MSDHNHLASGPRGHAGGAPDTRRAKRTTGQRIWMGSAAIAMALAWSGPAATDTPDPSVEPEARVSSNEGRTFASSEPLAEGFKVERVGHVISPFKDPRWKSKPAPKETESEIIMQRLDDLQTSVDELASQLRQIQFAIDHLVDPKEVGDWLPPLEDDELLVPLDWDQILGETPPEEPQE